MPELNRRAMAWCQANGMLEPALHYAHAAGETDAVTRIFEELVLPTYYAGGVATIESWLDWYDDELRGRYPTIAVLGAWLYFLTGRRRGGRALPACGAGQHRDPRTPGRQRLDRAVARGAARLHVPRWGSGHARGRRAGARTARPRRLVATDRAACERCGACVPRRLRACRRRARARGRGGGRGRRIGGRDAWPSPSSRCWRSRRARGSRPRPMPSERWRWPKRRRSTTT